jgi:hypothetical protein
MPGNSARFATSARHREVGVPVLFLAYGGSETEPRAGDATTEALIGRTRSSGT